MKTMVFSSGLMGKVRSREKVMTRRKVSWSKSGKPIERYKLWDICNLSLNRFFQGHCGRIQIISIYAEMLGHITDADAKLEGFANKEEFIATWKRIHGNFNPMCAVWVIVFKYLGESA